MLSFKERLRQAETRSCSGHENFIKLSYTEGELVEHDVSKCDKACSTLLLADSDCIKCGDPRSLFRHVKSQYCHPNTSITLKIMHSGSAWERLTRWCSLESRVFKSETTVNRISEANLDSIALIYGFRKYKREYAAGLPIRMPKFLDILINRFLLRLPLLRHLNSRFISCYVPVEQPKLPTVNKATVVIPARNEAGNIQRLEHATQTIFERLPGSEVIFVEGNSSDSTYRDLEALVERFPQDSVRLMKQDGRGKRDAVEKGFDAAVHDYLAIVDADLTVDLNDTIEAIKIGMASPTRLINCVRIFFPMQKDAMRFFNYIGNRVFATLLSYICGQTIGDALCGTKCMSRDLYTKLKGSGYWDGAKDPFGDFSILFGASRFGHEILNYPVKYYARTSGAPNISRWIDGAKLANLTLKEYLLP